MPHVVTHPCIGCKDTACVTACPVDAFREGEQMLVIDPETCIDCAMCVPECPTEAIFVDDKVPVEWAEYTAFNAEMAEIWPEITTKQEPLGEPG